MPQMSSPADWRGRLDAEVHKLQRSASYREVTYNRLKQLVEPPNDVDLLRAVSRMISSGQIGVFYRVISPITKAAIGRFSSPVDIPQEILDESTGDWLDVDPIRNVEAVYVPEAEVAD